MRSRILYLFLSLFIVVGSGQAFADHHKDHKGKDHKEQSHRPGGNSHKDHKDNKHKPVYNVKPGNNHRPGNNVKPGNNHKPAPAPRPAHSAPRPGYGSHPVRPAAPAHHYGHAHHTPQRLPYMVHHITKGCKDVNVWQVNADTYIVKYRKGHSWYTQYVYPYADRYSNPSLISVNWQPQTPWTFIPPIQLNINL